MFNINKIIINIFKEIYHKSEAFSGGRNDLKIVKIQAVLDYNSILILNAQAGTAYEIDKIY